MDIKIKEHLAKEKKDWKETVSECYFEFPEVFEDTMFNELPEH